MPPTRHLPAGLLRPLNVRGAFRPWLLPLGIALAAAIAPARAQLPPAGGADLSAEILLPEADNRALAQLERFRTQLAEERWDDALATLRELMQRHGDELVAVGTGPAGFTRYVPLRDHCHMLLVGLPAARSQLLPRYREQVDAAAAVLLEQGRRDRDPAPLKQLIDDMFASSHTDEALVLLGEIALERGEAATADRAWRQIDPRLSWQASEGAPPARAGQPLWLVLRESPSDDWPTLLEQQMDGRAEPELRLVVPDSEIPLADLLARQVLTSALAGASRRAELELAALRHLAPEASGPLGGREGPYDEILAPLVAESTRQLAPPGGDWPMPGGSPAHNAAGSAAFDPRLRLLWSRPLSLDTSGGDRQIESMFAFPPVRAGESYDEILAHHPIVVGDGVFVCDGQRMYGFDIASGASLWGAGEEGVIYRSRLERLTFDSSSFPSLGAARHTLGSDGSVLLARLGSPRTSLPADARDFEESGFVVGLDLASQGRLLPGFPLRPADNRWTFEGTPLIAGEYLYVALRGDGMRPEQQIACYELASGRLRWQTRICAAESFARGQYGEITHNLLSLAGDTLLANTSLGAVAALDVDTGRLRWLIRYPRDGTRRVGPRHEPWHVYRDLTPCLYHDGLVVVAPADSQQLFALDLVTGQLVWQTNLPPSSLDITHLLGVVDDKLIAAGRRLWWFDVTTGQLSADPPANPFPQAGLPDLTGFGRGFIAGGVIYWPTRGEIDEIFVFDGSSGRPLRQPIPLTPSGARAGNLVWAKDILLVAASDELFAFEAPAASAPANRGAAERADDTNP